LSANLKAPLCAEFPIPPAAYTTTGERITPPLEDSARNAPLVREVLMLPISCFVVLNGGAYGQSPDGGRRSPQLSHKTDVQA